MVAETSFPARGGETWRDPWDDYRRLRDHDPVHRAVHPRHGEFFVLTRFADVFDAVRDHVTFSSAAGLTLDPAAMDMFAGHAAPIVMMDPPEHTEIRRIVSGPLAARNIVHIEPMINAFVDERLDVVASAGGEVDIVAELFKPLPSMVVGHFLGVPPEDRDRFDGWTNAIVAANAEGGIEGAPRAAAELFGFAMDLIGRRRRAPGDDLVSVLVGAGDDRVSELWIAGFFFTMVAGGNDTTTGLLGGAAELLTEFRDQRRILLSDPSLVRRHSINEFLRLTSPVQNLARTTTKEVTVGDTVIPAGRKVLMAYGAANRDEREFGPHAQRLDVRRTIPRMLALGYGAHHCLGAAVARLMGSIAIERLLARFPDFEVDASAGRFAPGMFVRRYESLPFVTSG